MTPPVRCPFCKSPPRIRRGYHWRRGTWTAECSRDVSCPVHPITSNHPNKQAALDHWNSGEPFKEANLL